MKQLLVWCANDTIESKKSNIPREVLGPGTLTTLRIKVLLHRLHLITHRALILLLVKAQEIMLQTIKEVLDDRLNISWYSLPVEFIEDFCSLFPYC